MIENNSFWLSWEKKGLSDSWNCFMSCSQFIIIASSFFQMCSNHYIATLSLQLDVLSFFWRTGRLWGTRYANSSTCSIIGAPLSAKWLRNLDAKIEKTLRNQNDFNGKWSFVFETDLFFPWFLPSGFSLSHWSTWHVEDGARRRHVSRKCFHIPNVNAP